MTRVFVALLRGINVGRAKRVAMEDLRRVVEGLGHGDVRTLLNSGNVVFSSVRADGAQAARRIESAVAESLGVSARVTVLGAKDLASIVERNPLGKVATNPSRHLVAFFQDDASVRKLAPLLRASWKPEAIAVGPRVAYLWCPDSILESPLFDQLGRLMKDGVTTRNWGTVTKLHALASGGGS